MQYLFDLEFALGLQIGAAAPPFADDLAVAVREVAHRLGATGVDAEHIHDQQLMLDFRL